MNATRLERIRTLSRHGTLIWSSGFKSAELRDLDKSLGEHGVRSKGGNHYDICNQTRGSAFWSRRGLGSTTWIDPSSPWKHLQITPPVAQSLGSNKQSWY